MPAGSTVDPSYLPAAGAVSRATATINSPTGAVVTGAVAMAPKCTLLNLSTNAPTRLRLYATAAERAADQSRPVTSNQAIGSGLLFEALTTAGLLSFDCGPLVGLFNNEATITSNIAYTMEPTTSVNTTATLTYLPA